MRKLGDIDINVCRVASGYVWDLVEVLLWFVDCLLSLR